MEKIIISVDEMADILKESFERNEYCVSEEFCNMCSEKHKGCPVGDEDCPHDVKVEYLYFVRSHFGKFIRKNNFMPGIKKDLINYGIFVFAWVLMNFYLYVYGFWTDTGTCWIVHSIFIVGGFLILK